MSTSNLLDTHFDDSEDEEDNFNPQPADLSETEDVGGSDHDEDAGAQIHNEAARRHEVNDDDGSDEEVTISKRRSSVDDRDGEGDEEDEDAEGEGEDIVRNANDEEDEEDEEDDDEEEITVSFSKVSGLSKVSLSLLQPLTRSTGPSQEASTRTSQPVPRCRSRSRRG
jgi:transcription elongation factor SPT5